MKNRSQKEKLPKIRPKLRRTLSMAERDGIGKAMEMVRE